MPPEMTSNGDTPVPRAIHFADLFDDLGTAGMRYSAAARDLSGHAVQIEGFLSQPHGPHSSLSLVDQPGVCADCAPVPAAVIALPHARPVLREGGDDFVCVVGRLDYGFRIEAGIASMLRIEGASVRPVAPQS
jgi:hypothetical protein